MLKGPRLTRVMQPDTALFSLPARPSARNQPRAARLPGACVPFLVQPDKPGQPGQACTLSNSYLSDRCRGPHERHGSLLDLVAAQCVGFDSTPFPFPIAAEHDVVKGGGATEHSALFVRNCKTRYYSWCRHAAGGEGKNAYHNGRTFETD